MSRKTNKGPYSASRVGQCVCVFDATGLLLRVMPNHSAAENWRSKHGGESSMLMYKYGSKKSIGRIFDDQMQRGLTSAREIADLLWYSGVSSDWAGPKRNSCADSV